MTPAANAPAAPAAAPAPSAPSGGTGFRPSQLSDHASGITPAPAPAAVAPAPEADRTTGFIPDLDAPANDNDAPEVEVSSDDGEPADPWAEQIHGMTAKDLLAALKEGKLPDALLDALEHEYGDDDDKTAIKLRDALDQSSKERMQLATFHRELHKVRQQERDLTVQAEALQQSISGLNNPASLYDDLQGLGVSEETLEAAAFAYAQQKVEYSKLPAHMRKVLDDNRRSRIEAAQMRQELNQLKQREQSQQTQAQRQAAEAAMRTHGLPALLKFGLNPRSEMVQQKLGYYIDIVSQGKPWTREMVYAAAEATKQDTHALDRADKQAAAPNGRQPQGKPLSPSRAAAPQALHVPQQARKQTGFSASQLNALRLK